VGDVGWAVVRYLAGLLICVAACGGARDLGPVSVRDGGPFVATRDAGHPADAGTRTHDDAGTDDAGTPRDAGPPPPTPTVSVGFAGAPQAVTASGTFSVADVPADATAALVELNLEETGRYGTRATITAAAGGAARRMETFGTNETVAFWVPLDAAGTVTLEGGRIESVELEVLGWIDDAKIVMATQADAATVHVGGDTVALRGRAGLPATAPAAYVQVTLDEVSGGTGYGSLDVTGAAGSAPRLALAAGTFKAQHVWLPLDASGQVAMTTSHVETVGLEVLGWGTPDGVEIPVTADPRSLHAEGDVGLIDVRGRAGLPADATSVYLQVHIDEATGQGVGRAMLSSPAGGPTLTLSATNDPQPRWLWLPVDGPLTATAELAAGALTVTLYGWFAP
jgi:hypothetical protein